MDAIFKAYQEDRQHLEILNHLERLNKLIASLPARRILSAAHKLRGIVHQRLSVQSTSEETQFEHAEAASYDEAQSRYLELDPETLIRLESCDASPEKKTSTKKQLKSIATWATDGAEALKNHDWDKAIKTYHQVLELNPKHLTALMGQTLAFIKQHRLDEAKILCARIKTINNTQAQLLLGHIELKSGEKVKAKECYKNIIKKLNDDEHLEVCMSLFEAEEYEDGLVYCDMLMDKNPEYTPVIDFLNESAQNALKIGDIELAHAGYELLKHLKCSSKQNVAFNAMFELALLEASFGSYAEAYEYFISLKTNQQFNTLSKENQEAVDFGLLLCSFKLHQHLNVYQSVQELKARQPLWQEFFNQWLFCQSTTMNKDSHSWVSVYLVGEQPKELEETIIKFIRTHEFSQILIQFFFNLTVEHVKAIINNAHVWNRILPEQLNELYELDGGRTTSGLHTLLGNAEAWPLFLKYQIFRDHITPESLNTFINNSENRVCSALSLIMAHPLGPVLLARDETLCAKISIDGLNGQDLDVTREPSPLLLCANQERGQKLLSNNALLSSKITRNGLINACYHATTNPQFNHALDWLTATLQKPQYQSLTLHHRLLWFKPAYKPSPSNMALVATSMYNQK